MSADRRTDVRLVTSVTAATVAPWGDNLDGELGNGTYQPSPTPVAVVGYP